MQLCYILESKNAASLFAFCILVGALFDYVVLDNYTLFLNHKFKKGKKKQKYRNGGPMPQAPMVLLLFLTFKLKKIRLHFQTIFFFGFAKAPLYLGRRFVIAHIG